MNPNEQSVARPHARRNSAPAGQILHGAQPQVEQNVSGGAYVERFLQAGNKREASSARLVSGISLAATWPRFRLR